MEDGGPDRWASGGLGSNFSDPDGDHLSYAVVSSNESVVSAEISDPGPIAIVQAQGRGTATITIIARDPGGLTATQRFRVTVNDRLDHSNTPAGATVIAPSGSFQGRIDSPNDVDYFRLRVDAPGTLTIRTTGNADPDIAVFDGAGNEVPGVSGSWIGSITQEILDRGSGLLVRFSGGNAGGEYTGRATLDRPLQTSPDLEVGTPTVSDTSPETGASFTLSATVSNAGGGESAATTLRYYRSTDATITTSDTAVGTDAVGVLGASGSDSQSVELVAPSAPGPHYYGACVDTVAGESDSTNNCSTAVQVIVRVPERSDLMVVSSSVSNNSPTVGSQFTLSATVSNAGGGESAATTLRYYRSTDATITTSDTAVGTDAVGVLGASGSDSQSVELVAPSAPGPYYYGACVDTVSGESDTANNCSTAVQVTVRVPERSDLMVVSSSVSNNSPTVGSQFTLSATVRNAGGGESAATTLRYYRSTDATITTSDAAVGTDAVGVLGASGSDSQSVELVAPSAPGPYYYGACVDTVADESDTTNNCSVALTVDVLASPLQLTGEPDLVVASPSVNDSNPAAGASFTLSATVRNDGDGGSLATTLRYYRSTDATITTSDTEEGTDAITELGDLGSSSQSVNLAAPSSPGTYYYGACVDTVTDESDNTNNCSASVKVDVEAPKYPDLEVGTPTVSDTSPETGASFTLSATVSNTGDGESVATTLRYYRSTDATITTSDTAVGTDAVGALGASGTSAESISLNAPTTAGAYYYGACVDAVKDESDTTDNCSTSMKLDVEAPKYPDLEVGTPTVSDSTTETGASFTLSATVSNTGDGESVATTLRYYRSTDATITTSDTAVGTDAVGALGASGTSAESISLNAPTTAGAYYYGACADAVKDESDTTDNCSTSMKLDVEAPKYPDLEVGTPTVSDSTTETGASFTLSATVSNTGDGESVATTLRYYRSTDATITTSDTAVGTDAVSGLTSSGSGAESISLTAPATAGAYYYGACVDAVTDESDTTDNCSTSVKLDVEAPKYPDLEVGTPTVSDSTPETGASFILSATVSNTGDGESVATTLRYYRSTDATITTSDTAVGTDAVGALGASGTSAKSISLTAPLTAGTYYYGACVDAVTDESDTTNNCSSSVTIAVEEPSSGQPDLRIVGIITLTPLDGVSPGTRITFSVNVRNDGDANSDATTLRYYLSTDATISVSDTEVGTDEVSALVPSEQVVEGIDLTALSTGTYYYGACVDTVTGESDTTNNCSRAAEITVAGPQTSPDLSVGSPTVNNNSPEMGGAFTLSATVSNDGDGAAAATTLRYYRSTDATITTADTAVGTDAVLGLAASGSSAESISLMAPATAGTYYYGACVDAVAGESDTTNNCSSSVAVTVAGPQTSPDLSVGSPTVNNNSPEMGGAFTLSATVSNDGDGAAAATTLRYYRSMDATITTSDTAVGTDAVSGLASSGSSAESISLTAPSTAGTYYYGACVDAVTDEVGTTNNCSASVTVTVTELASKPDLIVDYFNIFILNPTLETSPGALVQLYQRVANVGDAASAVTTVRYYRSTDATITPSDTQVSTDAVPILAASIRFVETQNERLPTTPGTYYYGACVDAVVGESNTANNCSRSVKVTVPEPQPDLVVGSSVSVEDSNLNTGASFTLSATVRNAGDEQSAASTLRYYRSTDSTISSSDTQVGTDAVGALAASGTSDESISLTAPATAGTYYYGACVDAVTDESDTTNNCSSSVTIAVEEPSSGQPDLRIVGIITLTPLDGVSPGIRITFSVNVRNDGDANSDATTLRYYLSTDATISVSDTEVGTDEVSALVPSERVVEGIDLTAPSIGTYYYGACVDAVPGESDTTNNCSGAAEITVAGPQTSPDLSVGSPTVNNNSPEMGGAFTLSATVSNNGDGAAAATTLRYYRSMDATITTSDTAVGTDAVLGLAVSGSSAESISLMAPATAGTYYYGACVDAVAGESDTTNNCSSSVAVTVAGPQTSPDLSVGSPTVNNNSPEMGGAFTLSATVSNDGDGAAAATTLRYYRSMDATITTSDTAVGTDAVSGLASSGSSAESISLTAPSTAGTYYYGACVDAVTDEVGTTNNCSASVTVTVTELASKPDLIVDYFNIFILNPTLETSPGALVQLYQRVANVGDAASAVTTVRYYRSTDATITPSDTQVSTDAVPILAASIRFVETQNERLPTTPGTYYYGACVDAVVGESNTANNCSRSVKVTVPEPQPDLVVGSSVSVEDSNLNTGASFTLSATVRNAGDEQSAASTLRYYRSTDSTISSSDTQVGTDAVGALAASGTSDESISLTAPATAGAYYYGACVDAVTDESDNTNNCSSSVTIAVEEPSSGQPDLRIVGIITLTPLDGVSPGIRITFSVNVRNDGDANSDATTLRYYLSTDATISVSDTEVGTDEVSALVPSERVVEGIDLTAPSIGTYYYGACVDAVPGESDTTNNCSGAAEIVVN